ncbi:MAG: hypothetical protein CSA26_06500 [Desulfobacterales bacterium]|nr:MAG: hypothetical protein CSA26_06500 [Desulfobacterales bacterium]
MINLTILLLVGLSVCITGYGLFHIKFEENENDVRDYSSSTVLFKLLKPVIQELGAFNQRFISEKSYNAYRQKLINSGNRLNLVPAEFLAIKQLSGFTGACFGVFLVFNVGALWYTVVLFIGISFFLPDFSLRQTILNRKRQLFLELPFCMDLMALSMEAGLSFTLALEKVVENSAQGPLAQEFGKLLRDVRLGVPMVDALKGFRDRTDMYETRALVSAIIQADRLGTPLAEVLKTQSEVRRHDRFQKSEALAQEAPVKMLFPLLFFIFPAVFIMLLTPIFLKFMAEGM